MRVSSRLLRCFCQSKFWAIIRVELYSPVSRSLQCYRNEFFFRFFFTFGFFGSGGPGWRYGVLVGAHGMHFVQSAVFVIWEGSD